MSSHAYVGNLSFGATENLLRRPRVAPREVASVGAVQSESTGRSRRFVWSDRTVSVELEPAVAEPQPARAARSVWENGTLFGVMAKPRPARPVWANGTRCGVMAEKRPAWPVWMNGTLYGVMAGERPAPRPFGSN